MDSDSSPPAPPPWQHRPWCAPDCSVPPGGAEGTHLGQAWSLTPQDEETSQVALRLVEEPAEDSPGDVGVLSSVTERRLADDLDPFDEGPGQALGGELTDITSSVGLSSQEAGRLFEQLVAFAAGAQQAGGGNRPPPGP